MSLLSLLLLFLLSYPSSSLSPALQSGGYDDHRCSSISTMDGDVLEEPVISEDLPFEASKPFGIQSGYFGGDDLLPQDPPDPLHAFPRHFVFVPHGYSVKRIRNAGVLKLDARLELRGGSIKHHGEYFPRRVSFELSGFYSEITGALNMVGIGSTMSGECSKLNLSAVLNLSFPKKSTIHSSVIHGKVESLDVKGSPNHFKTVSLLAYAQMDYEHTLVSQAKTRCSIDGLPDESLGTEGTDDFCISQNMVVDIEYPSDRGSDRNSGLFSGSLGFSPTFLFLNQIQCSEDGKQRMFVGFANSGSHIDVAPMNPEKALVAEGIWDYERRHLCLSACRVFDSGGSLENVTVGDCTIGLSLRLPAVITLRNRSTITGRMWSNREKTDPDYFGMVFFRSHDGIVNTYHGISYEYTALDVARQLCPRTSSAQNGPRKRYPDSAFIQYMTFRISVRNAVGESFIVDCNTLTIFRSFVAGDMLLDLSHKPSSLPTMPDQNNWDVSYVIHFHKSSREYESVQVISAEGFYHVETGQLCMVGCRKIGASIDGAQTMDCDILISILLPSVDDRGVHERYEGTIKSTRERNDPYYFEPWEISSWNMAPVGSEEELLMDSSTPESNYAPRRMEEELMMASSTTTMVLVSATPVGILLVFVVFYFKMHRKMCFFSYRL